MKQILLTTAALAGAVGLAAAIDVPQMVVKNFSDNVKVKVANNPKSSSPKTKQLASGVFVSESNGLKRLNVTGKNVTSLKKSLKSPVLKSTTPDGYVLYESFENWDGDDYTWTPDGWSVDMRGDVDRNESWTPGSANPFLPGPSDGNYYYGINFSTGNQDEWLISPFVEVGEGMNLSYWLYLSPAFLFDLNDVDWDTMSFIGDPVVSATLQIWAQEEGGEWVMLRDYFDEYKEYTLAELFMMDPNGLEKNEVALTDFYGKKTRVAFRYVGTDGNTMFIDAIGIGYPSLDDVSYMSPFETLYWGFERTPSLTGLAAAIAQYPVYAPLTWTNMSGSETATYSWSYCDPETGDYVTSDDKYELSVTYVPDYRTEESKKNNFFYPPTLKAEAQHTTPGEYTAPYVYFQAGGKAERTLNDNTEFEPTLLPFNYHELGVGMTTVSDDEVGDFSIPVFGHSVNTNKYWLNYSLGGDEEIEGDYSHLLGVANLFIPSSEAPLVVNGVTVYGYGVISDDAELKATIYGLNSEWSNDIETFEVIATATITGADVLRQDPAKSYLCLPFDFAEPAVVMATEEHPAYMIMLEGFNSDKVEYFAPLQSAKDDPFGICNGYLLFHIDLSNHNGRPAYYNVKPMVYKEYGEYVDPASSFAIGLSAEYPWLTTDCKGIKFADGETAVDVALGSYYDGSKLTVTSPAGTTATVSGRYDECVLKVELNDAAVEVNGDVVVEGPGVKVTIPVSKETSGISAITNGASEVKAVYDLAGRCVSGNKLTEGVYIVKYIDGSTRKVVVK